jgi:hypothetical protein
VNDEEHVELGTNDDQVGQNIGISKMIHILLIVVCHII